MKSLIIILSLFLLSFSVCYSQRKESPIDFGLFVGGSYYIGDLNPNKHFNQFTKPAGGVLVRYNFSDRAALRFNFLMGTVEAHDAYSNSGWQKERNLDFRSQIKELSTQFEFNFLNYKIGGKDYQNFSPYIFIGLAGFHFEPEGRVQGGWQELQQLGTEGQGLPNGPSRRKYKLFQAAIPFGIGFKTGFSKGICIGFEWGMRKTFTDYVDDVSTRYYDPLVLNDERGALSAAMSDRSKNSNTSYTNTGKQRGNPTNKDWYSFFGVTLTLRIVNNNSCAFEL